MKKYLLLLLCVGYLLNIKAQQINPLIVKNEEKAQLKWVDSVYNVLSLEEKIGQLFMVDVFSNDSPQKFEKVNQLIKEQHIGGIIFSKGGPVRQANIQNQFQKNARIPLLIGMDAEWGLAMRLDSTYAYPWNMTLGAIKNDSIIYKVGKQIGLHSKRLGVHFNFAPVVDINTNPNNPIIGNRSFGESRENVTKKALAFMKGMQSNGVLANAKHFPGHGDTDSDSHKTLPTLLFGKERLDSIELYPYKKIINQGLSSVMVAHLNIPSLVIEPGYPSSISTTVVTNLLQKELGFNGLIFTDALNMKGAANFKAPGEIDLAAFLAGNDVLLISEDIPKAHQLLINAYREGVITDERLQLSVKKILMAKYKVGLNKYKPINTRNLVEDLSTVTDQTLYEQAIAEAITLIKNKKELLPIKNLKKHKIAYVNFGDDNGTTFLQYLNKYTKVNWLKDQSLDGYLTKLKEYETVIIGFHKSNDHPWKDYKFTATEIEWISKIAAQNKVILNVFARPYALKDFTNLDNIETILVSYQNSEIAQQVSAQIIFGARGANGVLPVTISSKYSVGTSIQTQQLRRLQYGTPESVGVSSEKLKKIDSLATKGYFDGMYPGAQILVARRGKVIYSKNFGYHEPNKSIKVTDTSLYDVASLTKILATLPVVMQLYDRKVINMETTLGEMLPSFKNSNKGKSTLKEMLSHYARFQAWIPFYSATLDKQVGAPSSKYYSKTPYKDFSLKVAEDLYMRNDYKDSIFNIIKTSDLRKSKGYKYSDLPFYLLMKYIEDVFEDTLDNVVQKSFYESLGANYSTYKPLEKFKLDQIPPTEQDFIFRMQKVHGYVHDQGASMLGGVGGHAGLFSNANDVAKIMQMYLWNGFYGGERYFNPKTLEDFNTCYFCEDNVRRGVGFDKPQLGDVGPTCGCVSMTSFGHSGFTGTFTWADPEEDIVYVFLSNRTFPDSENKMLISSNLRSDIQALIYDAIVK